MPKMSLTRALGFSLSTAALVATLGCGGDDSAPADAVLKFCNGLQRTDNQPIKLTLEYGTAPVKVPVTGLTCFPQTSQKCLAVPSGKRMPVVVRLDGSEEIFASMVIDVNKGDEMIFISAGAHGFSSPSSRKVPPAKSGMRSVVRSRSTIKR